MGNDLPDATPAMARLAEYEQRQLCLEQLVWERGSNPPLLPSTSPPPADDALVGRDETVEALLRSLQCVTGGRGASALVRGPRGIGRTRLLKHLRERAETGGCSARYLAVPCEPGAPPLWLWARVFQQTPGHAPRAGDAAAVDRVFARAGSAIEALEEGASADARFHCYDAVCELLLEGAQHAPIALLLDDLQHADAASLALLRHLLSRLSSAAVFVVMAFRDDDLPAPMGAELGQLETNVDQVTLLSGLSATDISELTTPALGRRRARRLAPILHKRTHGNPLYIKMLLPGLRAELIERESLDAEDTDAAILAHMPASLSLALRSQLARVSTDCRTLLRAASVLGRAFDVTTLAHLCEWPASRVEHHLRTLEQAHIMQQDEGQPGRYLFSHAPVVQMLSDELCAPRRAQLHARAAALLRPTASGLPELLRLAQHGLAAGNPAGHRLAMQAAEQASVLARRQRAHEAEAEALLVATEVTAARECAIAASDGANKLRQQRAQLMVRAAQALWRSGAHEAARARYHTVASLARSLGDAELLATAALGSLGTDMGLQTKGECLELGEEALARTADDCSEVRVRLLARLGLHLYLSPARKRGAELIEQAHALSGPTQDPTTELVVLTGRYYTLPSTASRAEQQAIIERVLDLGQQQDPPDLWLVAHHWRVLHALEIGAADAVQQHVRSFFERARASGNPLPLWLSLTDRCTLATLRGRLDEAASLAQQALSAGQRAQSPNALMSFLAQWIQLRRLQGRGAELVELLSRARERAAHVVDFRAGQASLLAELGHAVEARAELDHTLSLLADAPSSEATPYALCQLADSAFQLGCGAPAQAVYQSLQRFSDRCAVTRTGQVCDGSVDHFLGLAAHVCGRASDAIEHYERALHVNALLDAQPALARTMLSLGELLLQSAQDLPRARELADRTLATSQRLGLSNQTGRARALLSALGNTPRLPAAARTEAPNPGSPYRSGKEGAPPSGPHASERNAFRREGQYWCLAYGGQRVLLRDSKGLHYLGVLLAQPARQVHVLDLVSTVDGTPVAGTNPTGDPGLVVTGRNAEWELPPDGQSLQAYRARAGALRETLEEAEAMGDLGRKSQALEELEFLQRELSGQRRARHHPTERARKAVYNRIRAAIKQIGQAHEVLGRHLQTSIRTGTHCSYQPEVPCPWDTE